ncbi:IDEAL domain-containing protein [Bacillus taeanensis]|uniref:IDEAL domain-containing protein n=1 Tax=Bacillus taeanensis TaxID=273032 RepID=A0A366XXQ3_9BACI|nr:IDEAL domain-containing protein [Bacillus taeanensis]RBW70912.1 hypothetical protein DS031_02630 [Bacillus taeanensis]
MSRQNSYDERLRAAAREKQKKADRFAFSLLAQLELDEAFIIRQLKILEKEINKALDEGDKESFLKFSKEYKALTR